jgi:hypothetical protein
LYQSNRFLIYTIFFFFWVFYDFFLLIFVSYVELSRCSRASRAAMDGTFTTMRKVRASRKMSPEELEVLDWMMQEENEYLDLDAFPDGTNAESSSRNNNTNSNNNNAMTLSYSEFYNVINAHDNLRSGGDEYETSSFVSGYTPEQERELFERYEIGQQQEQVEQRQQTNDGPYEGNEFGSEGFGVGDEPFAKEATDFADYESDVLKLDPDLGDGGVVDGEGEDAWDSDDEDDTVQFDDDEEDMIVFDDGVAKLGDGSDSQYVDGSELPSAMYEYMEMAEGKEAASGRSKSPRRHGQKKRHHHHGHEKGSSSNKKKVTSSTAAKRSNREKESGGAREKKKAHAPHVSGDINVVTEDATTDPDATSEASVKLVMPQGQPRPNRQQQSPPQQQRQKILPSPPQKQQLISQQQQQAPIQSTTQQSPQQLNRPSPPHASYPQQQQLQQPAGSGAQISSQQMAGYQPQRPQPHVLPLPIPKLTQSQYMQQQQRKLQVQQQQQFQQQKQQQQMMIRATQKKPSVAAVGGDANVKAVIGSDGGVRLVRKVSVCLDLSANPTMLARAVSEEELPRRGVEEQQTDNPMTSVAGAGSEPVVVAQQVGAHVNPSSHVASPHETSQPPSLPLAASENNGKAGNGVVIAGSTDSAASLVPNSSNANIESKRRKTSVITTLPSASSIQQQQKQPNSGAVNSTALNAIHSRADSNSIPPDSAMVINRRREKKPLVLPSSVLKLQQQAANHALHQQPTRKIAVNEKVTGEMNRLFQSPPDLQHISLPLVPAQIVALYQLLVDEGAQEGQFGPLAFDSFIKVTFFSFLLLFSPFSFLFASIR